MPQFTENKAKQPQNYLSNDGNVTLQVRNRGVDVSINLVKMAYMYAQGFDVGEIAANFDVEMSTVRTAMRSQEFKDTMNSLTYEIVDVARIFLASNGIAAVRTLLDCMQSTNDQVRLRAAIEILDRIGLKEPTKIEVIQNADNFKDMTDADMLALIQHGMDELTSTPEDDEDAE